MSATTTSVNACIERLQHALAEDQSAGQRPPIERRKLKTLLTECRKRGTPDALATIDGSFRQSGLYCEPALTDSGLRRNDWVWISNGPLPPDSMFFPREADLRKFVVACLGTGLFRNLEPFKAKGRSSDKEHVLPDKSRIDLLCQERAKSGAGDLVAIEFEREHERGSVEQLISYMDALKTQYPDRQIKGIILSGREDRVSAARLPQAGKGYDIRWLCYRVSFHEVTSSSSQG